MFSVAFEGCALRAAFHIGVARWWDERGVRPLAIAGSSSGSLVAAAWAADALDVLEERWLDLVGRARPVELRRIARGRWPGRMSHILREGLEQDHGQLRMSDVPKLRIAVTRLGLRGRRMQVIDRFSDVRVVDAVLGSCFIPGPYSRPVWIGGRPVVDGAWVERAPVRFLPPGRRVAVVSEPSLTLRAGLVRTRTLPTPPDVRILGPEQELRARGFVFDQDAAREGIAAGRRAAERFTRASPRWLGGGA